MGWSGLGLGSGPHVVGRLGSGMKVSASFQIIPRGIGYGQLGSGPRVGASWLFPGGILTIFGRVGCLRGGSCLQGSYLLESQTTTGTTTTVWQTRTCFFS